MSKLLLLVLVCLTIYTRFVGLDWGLPYPFHPDERNMANAVQQLHCEIRYTQYDIRDCLNPHFFAYGQFPLYLSYFLLQGSHLIQYGTVMRPISFEEATLVLRIISAIVSVLTVWVGVKILQKLSLIGPTSQIGVIGKNTISLIGGLMLIFSPGLIQMAHFGTTESLLTFLYILLIYISLDISETKRYIVLSAFISGLAVATKVSSLIFLSLPMVILISTLKEVGIVRAFFRLVLFGVMTVFFAIVFSPHNIISFSDFISALRYESAVGLGTLDVFYTKQFFQTVPVLFQLTHILPYVLGWPVLVCSIGGLFFLPYRKPLNILRFAFLLYFISTASLYAKWTRFLAPVFPVLIIFGVLFLLYLFTKLREILNIKYKILNSKYKKNYYFIFYILYFISYIFFCLPGWAFLSIYLTPDVRFIASVWMAKNIPVESSSILTETANVVDLPIAPYGLDSIQYQQIGVKNISFNFYDLDANPFLQQDLQSAVQSSTYLFIPSRRVFKNYTCIDEQTFRHSGEDPDVTSGDDSRIKSDNTLKGFRSWMRFAYQDDIGITNAKCNLLKKQYPLLDTYYKQLFSGELGFQKVAEFESYPRINILGKEFIFKDEDAEETWSVFDHPVVRIYKRM